MTPICVIELLIRRLAFPTVNSAFHFALECVREVTIILLHFLNPLVGHVRSHRLQEIVLCIYYWLNSRSSVFSVYQRRERRPQAECPLLYFYLKQSSFPHHQISIWKRMSYLSRRVLTDMSTTTTAISVILKFFSTSSPPSAFSTQLSWVITLTSRHIL
jgi:hypothetical protein